MKRKLASSERRKGIQSITKFFKAVTSQGDKKQNCGSAKVPVMVNTSKEDDLRSPNHKKYQVTNTKAFSEEESKEANINKSALMPRVNGYHSQSDTLLNAKFKSPDKWRQPQHSTPVDDTQNCYKKLYSIHSPAEEDEREISDVDCEQTFHSANERSSTLYDTCCESFSDTQSQAVVVSTTNEQEANKSKNEGSVLPLGLQRQKNGVNTNKRGCDISCDDEKENESMGICVGLSRATMSPLPEGKDSLDQNQDDFTINSPYRDLIGGNCAHNKEVQNQWHGFMCFGKDKCVEEDSSGISGSSKNGVEESGSFEDHEESQHNETINDRRKEIQDEIYKQVEKSFNNVDRESDSDDVAIYHDSDPSDEELLTPITFFSSKFHLKPDIRTPEKGVAPENFSPSPVISTEVKREEKTKYKLSFDKIIHEREKKREKDAELAKIEEELQRGLKQGGIFHVQEQSTVSDIESEEELTDDGRDLKDCTLPKDIKKFLVDVHDFSVELIGEDIFPLFQRNVTSQDFPCLSMRPPPEDDTFESKLLTASSRDLQELLCGGWILQHYLDRPCPPDVAYWLFQILCRHSDRHIIKSSFDVLWLLTEAAAENRKDLPQRPRGSSWVPSVKKVVMELLRLGATIPQLYPGNLVDALNIKEMFFSEIDSGEIQIVDVTVSGGPQTECFPAENIMHLVQFITHCLQKCPRSVTVQDLRNLVLLMCRLSLDVRLQTRVFDIEMCLAAAMNCYGEMQWPDEVKELCSIVVVLSSHHRNLLHLVEIQPPSVPGVQLQRLVSATLLQWLVPKFCEQVEAEKNCTSERCDAPVPDSIEVSNLVKLVERLKCSDESDYFLLHTIISLVSFAVGSEELPSQERGPLEKLTDKLRKLNGDIKDPRAAFMDRTKVKDLLLRTIFRLSHMTQCIKPSREQPITSYFEHSGSGYEVELLKGTEINEGEELSSNEDDDTTEEQMDFTF
ncbi:SMC5-SMC6 complex localization factor protein 2-like isoform X1 [Acropora palmata]|uniref:SMC5-SMC6 complex localization factor protein 2-like isoform X1 n=2 Tax=Acropora palmata TaxID=6131 RepID=UPI003DA1151F